MANSKTETVENTFMDFKAFERGTARLQWVLALLAHMEIPFQVNENVVLHNACMVRLRSEDIVPAQELIQLEINANISVSIDDLHPQHSFFTRDMIRFGVDTLSFAEEAEVPTEAQAVAEQVDKVLAETATAEDNAEGNTEALGLSEEEDDSDSEVDALFDDDEDEEEGSEEEVEEPEPEIELIEGKEWKAAEEVLTHEMFDLPGTNAEVQLFSMPSSNLLQYGYRGIKPKEEGEKPKCAVFARFKSGGTLYRYKPVSVGQARSIISEAVKRTVDEKAGRETKSSAGSLFSQIIRTPADEGKLTCHRLTDEGKWTEVLPKHLRPKKVKKQ